VQCNAITRSMDNCFYLKRKKTNKFDRVSDALKPVLPSQFLIIAVFIVSASWTQTGFKTSYIFKFCRRGGHTGMVKNLSESMPAGWIHAAESEGSCTKIPSWYSTTARNNPNSICTTDSGLCRCRRCLASRLIPSASRTWRNKTTIFSRENPISRRPCRTTAPPNRDLTKLCPGSSWAVFWVIFLVLSVANPMLWLLRQLWSNCWRRLRLAFHPLLRQSHSGVFRIRCRIPHVYEFVYLHLYYNIPTTKMGKNDIVSMLLIALIHSSSE